MDTLLCIGDIRDVCQEHFARHRTRLPFDEAYKRAIAKGAREYSETDGEEGHMSVGEFAAFIDSIPLIFEQTGKVQDIEANQRNAWYGNFYLQENFLFLDKEDIIAHIHIPFVDDGMHTHDHFEMNYVYNGEATIDFKNEHKTVGEGALCIFAPYSPHCIKAMPGALVIAIVIRKTTFETIFASLLKQSSHLSAFLRNSMLDKTTPNYLVYQTDNCRQLQHYMQEILREMKRKDPYCSMSSASILSLFFAAVIRQHENTATFFDLNDETWGSYNSFLILQYINQNYRTVTLTELADVFHYSETYLSRKIRETTGLNYSQLLQRLRLEKSKILLETTQWNVSTISEAIGYESPDYFCRLFKKKYNTTPIQYRAQHEFTCSVK